MAKFQVTSTLLFVLFLIIAAHEMQATEARYCYRKSHWGGQCNYNYCDYYCKNKESYNYDYGNCQGSQCYCYYKCKD